MWFADIYCDAVWLRDRNGVLGPARFKLRGPRSRSLGINVDFHFFGDDEAVRHVRVLMHTDDQRIAEACLDLNIQDWVAALEVAVMLETNRPFHVLRLPNSQTFAIAIGQGDEQSPAPVIGFTAPESKLVHYQALAFAVSAWSGDLSQYLFYFRRLVDGDLPLDVRWLNGYRLLEWHFVRDRAGLSKNSPWKQFVSRFDAQLTPLCRPNQKPVGLIEEARGLAAHAGLDSRTDAERAIEPRNAMERTFRILESMVVLLLNEHPSRAGHALKWLARNDVQRRIHRRSELLRCDCPSPRLCPYSFAPFAIRTNASSVTT